MAFWVEVMTGEEKDLLGGDCFADATIMMQGRLIPQLGYWHVQKCFQRVRVLTAFYSEDSLNLSMANAQSDLSQISLLSLSLTSRLKILE